jgi:hypothetical protein
MLSPLISGRRVAAVIVCLSVSLVALFFTSSSIPLLPVSQSNRLIEMDALMVEARDHNYILVKKAGSGQQDMQCCSVNGWMPAAWADDPGLYVVSAMIAIFTSTTISESYSWFYRVFKALYFMGCIFLSWFIARQFRFRFSSVFCVLTVAICGTQLSLGYLPFVNYGIGRGDLFYGSLSVVMFAAIGLVLLVASVIRETNKKLTNWVGIISVCFITAFAELFRSGALLLLPLIFMTFCFSVKKKLLWWYVSCVFIGAWFASLSLALSITAVRWAQTGIPIDIGTTGHGIWHTLYLGLSFSIDGSDTSFGIPWSDNYLYDLLLGTNPKLQLYSNEYQRLVRHMYLEQLAAQPKQVFTLYLAKSITAVLVVWKEIVFLTVLAAILKKGQRFGAKIHLMFGVAATGASLMGLVVAMPQTVYLVFATPWLQVLVVVLISALVSKLATQAAAGPPSAIINWSSRWLRGGPHRRHRRHDGG